MKENILMYILSRLITLYHKREKLTRTERFAQAAYLNHIEIKKRNPDNKKPTIYAMIGLVGSGKTTIARDINAQTGASIINGDEIRIKLRQMNS